jgi:hypothetical protein
MGAGQSKERAQQGMLGQMKGLLGPGRLRARAASQSSLGSAPPSPHCLADTLASPRLQEQFLAFLQALDRAAGVPADHCGLADSLEFVAAVKRLRGEEELQPGALARYFPLESPGGLVLGDPGLWRRCQEAGRGGRPGEDGRRALELARERCTRQLAREHTNFLAQRAAARPSAVSRLAPCCVLL